MPALTMQEVDEVSGEQQTEAPTQAQAPPPSRPEGETTVTSPSTPREMQSWDPFSSAQNSSNTSPDKQEWNAFTSPPGEQSPQSQRGGGDASGWPGSPSTPAHANHNTPHSAQTHAPNFVGATPRTHLMQSSVSACDETATDETNDDTSSRRLFDSTNEVSAIFSSPTSPRSPHSPTKPLKGNKIVEAPKKEEPSKDNAASKFHLWKRLRDEELADVNELVQELERTADKVEQKLRDLKDTHPSRQLSTEIQRVRFELERLQSDVTWDSHTKAPSREAAGRKDHQKATELQNEVSKLLQSRESLHREIDDLEQKKDNLEKEIHILQLSRESTPQTPGSPKSLDGPGSPIQSIRKMRTFLDDDSEKTQHAKVALQKEVDSLREMLEKDTNEVCEVERMKQRLCSEIENLKVNILDEMKKCISSGFRDPSELIASGMWASFGSVQSEATEPTNADDSELSKRFVKLESVLRMELPKLVQIQRLVAGVDGIDEAGRISPGGKPAPSNDVQIALDEFIDNFVASLTEVLEDDRLSNPDHFIDEDDSDSGDNDLYESSPSLHDFQLEFAQLKEVIEIEMTQAKEMVDTFAVTMETYRARKQAAHEEAETRKRLLDEEKKSVSSLQNMATRMEIELRDLREQLLAGLSLVPPAANPAASGTSSDLDAASDNPAQLEVLWRETEDLKRRVGEQVVTIEAGSLTVSGKPSTTQAADVSNNPALDRFHEVIKGEYERLKGNVSTSQLRGDPKLLVDFILQWAEDSYTTLRGETMCLARAFDRKVLELENQIASEIEARVEAEARQNQMSSRNEADQEVVNELKDELTNMKVRISKLEEERSAVEASKKTLEECLKRMCRDFEEERIGLKGELHSLSRSLRSAQRNARSPQKSPPGQRPTRSRLSLGTPSSSRDRILPK